VVSYTRYQLEVAAVHRAGEPVDLRAESLAENRLRKTIVRAFGDLLSIYAADIIADSATGNEAGYQLY